MSLIWGRKESQIKRVKLLNIQSNLGQKQKCKLVNLPLPVRPSPPRPAERLQTSFAQCGHLLNSYCVPGMGVTETDAMGTLPTKRGQMKGWVEQCQH